MVYLNRIYTRGGDKGETSLGDGTRVPKTHPRIVAYGGTDELNAVIGVALAVGLPGKIAEYLRQVQNDLFDLGADLCVPEQPDRPATQADALASESERTRATSDSGLSPSSRPLRVSGGQIERLEGWIDEINESLGPLKSFVLPGGTAASAHLHQARAVCRRVEIDVLELAEAEPLNPQIAVYLNRLSDLLFVMARLCNDGGRGDVLWVPGRGASREATNAE